MKGKNSWIKEIFNQLVSVITASVLFALSFPNPLFENGLPLLAWFAYIPVLLVIQKSSLLPCIGWGAIYGCLSYALFNYWLMTFHPLAGVIVYGIYMVFLAVVFLFLRLAVTLYPKRHYIVQWAIFIAFEYLCSLGFIGYPYGITGYSQWRILPVIQISSVTGVWGVSAIITFPSFFLAAALKDLNIQANVSFWQKLKAAGIAVISFIKNEKITAFIYVILLASMFIFGFSGEKDFSNNPSVQIALIQHNSDPWTASNAVALWQQYDEFRNDLDKLKRLSDEAIASFPKPALVVWPETAFVPRIYWHTTFRDDQNAWYIVRDLLEYLSEKDTPFLIGNDDARMDPEKNPNANERFLVDYNAALLFENGQITEIYRKQHLVPFTEHFPYRKILPFLYNFLHNEKDTHFWEKGDDKTVFSLQGFTFSAPICFEDTFGNISRDFVRSGADILINLTNDAWAKSLSSQNQHLSMAVFRAVENHRPMVRSTVSGQTCAIDPTGKITEIAPPFTQSWLNVSVPLVNKNTIYTLYGDYLGIAFLTAALILLIFGAVRYTIKKS